MTEVREENIARALAMGGNRCLGECGRCSKWLTVSMALPVLEVFPYAYHESRAGPAAGYKKGNEAGIVTTLERPQGRAPTRIR
jgi:hypothetical protein